VGELPSRVVSARSAISSLRTRSATVTGSRTIRPLSASARPTAWRIQSVA